MVNFYVLFFYYILKFLIMIFLPSISNILNWRPIPNCLDNLSQKIKIQRISISSIIFPPSFIVFSIIIAWWRLKFKLYLYYVFTCFKATNAQSNNLIQIIFKSSSLNINQSNPLHTSAFSHNLMPFTKSDIILMAL